MHRFDPRVDVAQCNRVGSRYAGPDTCERIESDGEDEIALQLRHTTGRGLGVLLLGIGTGHRKSM